MGNFSNHLARSRRRARSKPYAQRRLTTLGTVALAAWSGWSIADAAAPEDASPPPVASQEQSPAAGATPEAGAAGAPLRLGGEVIEPFAPLAEPGPEVALHGESLAWYMTAQLHLSRGEAREGVDALKRAVASDPKSLAPYALLAPVLLELGEVAEARTYALQACQQDSKGTALVQGVALVLARTNRVDQSISLLKEALQFCTPERSQLQYLNVLRLLGSLERLAGRPAEAAEHYRIVFEPLLDPGERLTPEQHLELLGDAGATFEEFGQVFLLAEMPDLALQAFDAAAKHRPGRPAMHSYNLALLFRKTGKPAEALGELDKYLAAQLQTKGRAAYQLLKELLGELGRGDELTPRLRELADADPRNASLVFFLADELLDAGELDEALQRYQDAPAGERDPRALVGLTEIYRRKGDARALIGALTSAYQVVPVPDEGQELPPGIDEDVKALSVRFVAAVKAVAADAAAMDGLLAHARTLQGTNPPTLEFPQAYIIGKLAIDASRSDDALQLYRYAIGMLNEPRYELFREISSHLIDVKRYDDACKILEEAIQHPALEAEKWLFQALLCAALEMQGKTDEALRIIGEARLQQPRNLWLAYREGWVNYHAQRFDAAIMIFEEVIASTQGDPEQKDLTNTCRFSISAIHVQRGDYPRGEQILQDVLKDDPENIQANNDLGYLWADQNKNLDQALTMIEKALQAEPENSAYLDSMGWVLFRLGKPAEARDFFLKAVSQARGEDSTIWDHLGDCYEKLGERDAALDAWAKALQMELDKPHPDEKLVNLLKGKLPAERHPAGKSEAQAAAPANTP